MTDNDEIHSHLGIDSLDHQPVYIYAPACSSSSGSTRPVKRRKVARAQTTILGIEPAQSLKFEPLLNGLESPECVALRQQTFEHAWSRMDKQIQSILNEANEDTLGEVTAFVHNTRTARLSARIPTGFIVTGPNISSHSLLFKQLSKRLKMEINGPNVVLRSSDASNLKAFLKLLIRKATNQSPGDSDEEGLSSEQVGRKLLNYDLEILHGYVKAHGSQAAVIAFQDSEAFDSSLISELVNLFSSWMDRIPFVLLFGIATSLDLFHARLSRSASRFLDGVQFDVEQTSSVLERIFQKAVIASEAPLRLGSALVSSLMERQHDHVQSVQSFITALKYAYMCHFYGNPLSWLSDVSASGSLLELVQSHHLEVVKALPSFQRMVEGLVQNKQLARAEALLQDDKVLLKEIMNSLECRNVSIIQLLQAIYILSSSSSESLNEIDLYITAFQGGLSRSDFVKRMIDSLKRMAPAELVKFIEGLSNCIENGNSEVKLAGLRDEDDVFLRDLRELQPQVAALALESVNTGKPIRNSYAIHSKGLRTTVIAQRVQLSFENSTLTEQDIAFTALVDHLAGLLEKYFSELMNPQEIFLNEVWLYDWTIPQKSVFMPRPREATELALSAPYHYLSCECCESAEGLLSTHPAASILFQMCLETGSFINIFDLWSAFLEMVGGGEEQKCEERDALVMFYRGLADLKSLGIIKQSKKKADHLAKIAWKGL